MRKLGRLEVSACGVGRWVRGWGISARHFEPTGRRLVSEEDTFVKSCWGKRESQSKSQRESQRERVRERESQRERVRERVKERVRERESRMERQKERARAKERETHMKVICQMVFRMLRG